MLQRCCNAAAHRRAMHHLHCSIRKVGHFGKVGCARRSPNQCYKVTKIADVELQDSALQIESIVLIQLSMVLIAVHERICITCKHACLSACAYKCLYTCHACLCTCSYVCLCPHRHPDARTHAYTCAHTHAYTQSPLCKLGELIVWASMCSR